MCLHSMCLLYNCTVILYFCDWRGIVQGIVPILLFDINIVFSQSQHNDCVIHILNHKGIMYIIGIITKIAIAKSNFYIHMHKLIK